MESGLLWQCLIKQGEFTKLNKNPIQSLNEELLVILSSKPILFTSLNIFSPNRNL